MEVYIKHELSGGGSPRHLNTFYNLFIVVVYYTHQYIRYIVAIVDCTLVGSATTSFKNFVTLHWITLQQIF